MRLFSDVSERIVDPWLCRAFTLAEHGRGSTSPNPLVGCVIVRDGQVIGEGYHARAGLPHAEVIALEAAGDAARGATVYVTLEPCTHHGRTPPCTDALIECGVARVVIGMLDPNTAVSGGGAEALRAAGVVVSLAEDDTPFVEQNEAWVASLRRELPFVRVKVATSLDGHSALREGMRADITGETGADLTRRLRASADAVLVGAATVAIDDPALTVRDADGTLDERQPLRVVLGRSELPPSSARVFRDNVARTLLLVPSHLAEKARAMMPHFVEVAEYDLDGELRGALRTLYELGVVDLLVEPGPRLLTALWEAALIDELVLVNAGGMAGPSAPSSFLGDATESSAGSNVLSHVFGATEAGILGDVAVTIWRSQSGAVVGQPDSSARKTSIGDTPVIGDGGK